MGEDLLDRIRDQLRRIGVRTTVGHCHHGLSQQIRGQDHRGVMTTEAVLTKAHPVLVGNRLAKGTTIREEITGLRETAALRLPVATAGGWHHARVLGLHLAPDPHSLLTTRNERSTGFLLLVHLWQIHCRPRSFVTMWTMGVETLGGTPGIPDTRVVGKGTATFLKTVIPRMMVDGDEETIQEGRMMTGIEFRVPMARTPIVQCPRARINLTRPAHLHPDRPDHQNVLVHLHRLRRNSLLLPHRRDNHLLAICLHVTPLSRYLCQRNLRHLSSAHHRLTVLSTLKMTTEINLRRMARPELQFAILVGSLSK